MNQLILKDPIWLLALAALPLLIWLRGRRSVPVLLVPFAAAWHRPSLASLSRWPIGLALVGLALLIVALARPQRVEDKREVRSQGYDIMLSIDLSTSMLSEDFERDGERINRLQAIKPVIQAFIEQRPADRIGGPSDFQVNVVNPSGAAEAVEARFRPRVRVKAGPRDVAATFRVFAGGAATGPEAMRPWLSTQDPLYMDIQPTIVEVPKRSVSSDYADFRLGWGK